MLCSFRKASLYCAYDRNYHSTSYTEPSLFETPGKHYTYRLESKASRILVKMDSSPFLPGTKAFIHVPILPAVCTPPVSTGPRSFVLDIPARIGLSVKNMATFGPGKAGGGGIGFSANLYSSTFCCVLPSTSCEVVVHAKRAPVIKHHVEVFLECLRSIGWSPLFSVLIVHEDRFPAHCGLGSTSGAALGTLHGLNMCLEEPFTREEIRRILACNYVEESQEEGKSD